MSGHLFAVSNNHIPTCGTPPSIPWEKAIYRGYFENAFGEQWLLWQSDDDKKVRLHGGDLGWEDVTTFTLEELAGPEVRISIILNDAERGWLLGCLTAITNGKVKRVISGHRGTRALDKTTPVNG